MSKKREGYFRQLGKRLWDIAANLTDELHSDVGRDVPILSDTQLDRLEHIADDLEDVSRQLSSPEGRKEEK